jgi:hypothetical protein
MNITRADKQTVIEIISQSMGELPGIKWIIGDNPRKLSSRIHAMADYLFETAFTHQGIILSSNKKGVAILFRKDIQKSALKDYWNMLKFLLRCTGIRRALEIYKRERYIESQRPCNGKYLHFWVFSVLPSSREFGGAASELKNIIIAKSERQQLPIYLETSNPKNKRVYERYGFKVYHEWYVPHRDFTLWFMKRDIAISTNINS